MLCIFKFLQKCKEIIHVHQKCGNHHIWPIQLWHLTFFIYANRNKAEPREVTKQVVWIILRNRILHGTIRHIRSGFSLYARTLCALTLLAYALKSTLYEVFECLHQLSLSMNFWFQKIQFPMTIFIFKCHLLVHLLSYE